MRCPKCNQANLDVTSGECPQCGFHGEITLVETLSHIKWLLGEMTGWTKMGFNIDVVRRLGTYYGERQKAIEVKLGLREKPLTQIELRNLWAELIHHEAFFERMRIWHVAGNIKDGVALPDHSERMGVLRQRLQGYTRLEYPRTRRERLDVVDFMIEAVGVLQKNDAFTSPEAEQKIRKALQAEKEMLEVQLGLRSISPTPVDRTATVTPNAPVTPKAPADPSVPRPSAPPPQPFGERLRRSILSERTLQALIFLGIFLLFTAAISFVYSGWKDFSAPLRVGIPTIFSLIFLGLGWLVRTRTKLYRSGIALTAIFALLVPIDAYTIYFNYVPTQNWSQFWVIASIFSLMAYILLTLQIQSRFFGYLVTVAAGSLILALMEVFGQPRDYYGASLSVLALAMLVGAAGIERGPAASRFRVFIEPFRYIALWLPAILMPLTMGQWLVTHYAALDALQKGTTATWFLGGFVFGWGAVRYRSVGLGRLAALALPVAVFMGQIAIFNQFGFHRAWHAFGLSLLTPLYLFIEHRLSTQSVRRLDPMLVEHANSAGVVGWIMVAVSAVISLLDLSSSAPAAAAHIVLAASISMSAILWQRPRLLHLASFFTLTAVSFEMNELHFNLNQLGIGWDSLAIFYVLLALALARVERGKAFLSTLVNIAYTFAALAILPALMLYNSSHLTYTLGNFIALSMWGASLAHQKRPGFYSEKQKGAIFHWFAALPLPFWLWIALNTPEHPADFSLALDFAVLAWGMVAASHWLRFTEEANRRPWHLVGIITSIAAPILALILANGGFTPSVTILSAGLLYFADALISRRSTGLYPAGLVTALGLGLLLEHLHVDWDVLTFSLCLLVGVYLLLGLLAERRKLSPGTPGFLTPLYHTAHIIALIALLRIYIQPLIAIANERAWTDQMQIWGSVDQLLLAGLYLCYAWGRYNKAWAFISVWLAAAGGGMLITLYSSGQGSLAAKGALIVTALILAERSMLALRHNRRLASRLRAYTHLLWNLYRQPLIFTGWAASVAVIILAFVRNYIMLGGGRIQQIWAAVALLILTALYALSARLFKQVRFVWFAAALIFLPWTILANLGWLLLPTPAPSQFAISWMALAWVYFLVSLLVRRYADKAYVTPLVTAARLLTPFSLLWAPGDVATGRIIIGMAIALYAVAAWEDYRQSHKHPNITAFAATKFLYPTLLLIPLWAVYWLKFLQPSARHEHFGLLLLSFGAIGLLTGKLLLERITPRPDLTRAYALPAYITGYVVLTCGLLLTAHIPSLLAFALLYAALLMFISAWLFRAPIWIYPASTLLALSLLATLSESAIPFNRRGWWLIGLGAIYLSMGWLLRRFKLRGYASGVINMAFVLIALGLPPSSLDRIGAFWGYGSAALLYTISAFWMGQPLLLVATCALLVIPYASALQLSSLDTHYYGMALFPGAVASLVIGVLLDTWRGTWRDFPWADPMAWLTAFVQRVLGWWGLSFYILGFGLATAAPIFAAGKADLVSLSFLLLTALYTWAIFRFRGRFWLLGSALALHLAMAYFLFWRGFHVPLNFNAEFWLNFMPMTVLTLGLGLGLQKRFNEDSPLVIRKFAHGWSRPLYLFALADLLIGQIGSLQGSAAGIGVTLIHMLLIGLLASVWGESILSYITTLLGLMALMQWRAWHTATIDTMPPQMAWLALGYGLFGFGYHLYLRWQGSGEEQTNPQPRWLSIWEIPLQRSAIFLSTFSLLMVPVQGIDLAGWTLRALFGASFRDMVEPKMVWMAIWTFSLVGFVYVAAAVVYRRLRLGYLAVGLLMSSWFLYAFYINIWANLRDAQWYALPAGIYLLIISALEWTLNSNKRLARWLDYAALLLLMGSLFWQTLSLGLLFCVLLILESLAIFGWGIMRRLRRFFYTGIAGVILAVLAEFINSVQNPNAWTWVIGGAIGLLIVVAGILAERRIEAIKAWDQRVLETWE